jgi:hypothetical protein
MTNKKLEQDSSHGGEAQSPMITQEHIDGLIAGADFYVFPGTTVTVCLLRLDNGFSVIGKSACVHSDNFNKAVGRKIAMQHARDKLWQLEGYLLCQQLYEARVASCIPQTD